MFDEIKDKWDAIDVMAISLMANPDLIKMMNGFILEGAEIGHFPRLIAIFLSQDGLTADQPNDVMQVYVNKAIEQVIANREVAKNVYPIPDELMPKYKGCGNGIVTIEKGTRKVLDFDYTDSKLRVSKKQNIKMSKHAGRKIMETDEAITYRANFSSCQVCLF
jgi:hypothetical protein